MKNTEYTTRLKENYAITHFVKIYPDRYSLIIYKIAYSNVYTEREKKPSGRVWQDSENEKLDYLDESLRHTKTRLSDIIICNNFDTFVTFTLNCSACIPKCRNNPCKCNKDTCKRFDVEYAKRTQETWMNNQIKRYGRFPYVLVMEFHKNMGIHFHALFKDYKGKLVFWKLDKDKKPIYNLGSYKKGYSTAKKIYDITGAAKYMSKYITKDMPVFQGKKRYWCSQGLLRPVITHDEALMSEIISNTASTEWIPLDNPTVRENNTIKMTFGNVDSVITLMHNDSDIYQDAFNRLNGQA